MSERTDKITAEQAAISLINRSITDLMNERRKHEEKIHELQSQAPNQMVILAARHLDPSEGPVTSGYTLKLQDVHAIRTVLRFVAEHKGCEGSSQ